jgi:hypothetical protein
MLSAESNNCFSDVGSYFWLGGGAMARVERRAQARDFIDPLHWRHKSLECPPDAP